MARPARPIIGRGDHGFASCARAAPPALAAGRTISAMGESVARFYDHLAEDYHLIFADWSGAVARQAEVLDAVVRRELGPGSLSLLDCACGIGTQAIGLAARGYRVVATDISPAAVERARNEAEVLGVRLTTGVADLRTLADQVPGEFDVVLTCDNALPHLLSEAELLLAARGMWAKVRRDGLLLASIRDYDEIVAQRPRAELPRVFDGPAGRRIVFQVWDWERDGRTYTLHLFIVRQAGSGWQTTHRATRYRALPRGELSEILGEAGFCEVRWLMPEESGYYQPIVVARRRDGRQHRRVGDAAEGQLFGAEAAHEVLAAPALPTAYDQRSLLAEEHSPSGAVGCASDRELRQLHHEAQGLVHSLLVGERPRHVRR
jgi:glycine/sarcosine N-methyltransferase